MKKRDLIIYGLTDPRTDDVRYIGRSIYGLDRARQLVLPSAPRRIREWRAEIVRAGFAGFGIRVLARATSFADLVLAELRCITAARADGWRLINRSDTVAGGIPVSERGKFRWGWMRELAAGERERVSDRSGTQAVGGG